MPQESTAIEFDAADLSQEKAIVWLEALENLPYVRCSTVLVSSRGKSFSTAPTPHRGARLVGYSTLRPDARPKFPHMFERRAFWVSDKDRINAPDGPYRVSCPPDAVDPLTVAAGEAGRKTERCSLFIRPMNFPGDRSGDGE